MKAKASISVIAPDRQGLRRGIYALPNVVTLFGLFAGFYAIVMAFNQRFELAVLGIFVAAVLDSLDGRLARLTQTQSAFGEQMDSMSDMVCFGAAPALIAYVWMLKDAGRWGWIASFIYVACAALRLARFNINTAIVDRRFFQGLPSPAAAILVMGFIWLVVDKHIHPSSDVWTLWVMFGLVLYAGLTMVTNVPFYSFKEFRIRKSVPFAVLVLSVLGIGVIGSDPPIALFILFSSYALSGYVLYLWRKYKGHSVNVMSASTSPENE